MANTARAEAAMLGSLRLVDGTGVVRLEHRLHTNIEDVWSALTDPGRLVRWLGEVDGDLRPGGEFRARYYASGWEGTVRVQLCEPPRRLLIHTQSPDEPDGVIEVTLTADGEQTSLAVEDRGLPLDQIAAYGAGDQIHVEDLAAYLAGRERGDARERWKELHPGLPRYGSPPRLTPRCRTGVVGSFRFARRRTCRLDGQVCSRDCMTASYSPG